MSRERFIWDRDRQEMVPAAEFYASRRHPAASSLAAPLIMRDISPYRSTITGEEIAGRRQHRDHLRAHGCVEVGNDFRPPVPQDDLPPVRESVERAMQSAELRAEAMAASRDAAGAFDA